MLGLFSKARFTLLSVSIFGTLAFALIFISDAFAQSDNKPVRINARAIDVQTLVSGNFEIKLWGVQTLQSDQPVFNLRALKALEGVIDGHPVECSIMKRSEKMVTAQCVNDVEEDLSLFLLSEGYVYADRQAVYGTVFEKAYINAEARAQADNKGLWALTGENGQGGTGGNDSRTVLLGGSVLVGILIVVLVGVTIFILKGFRTVVEVQNQSMDLAGKERVLREKEKIVIVSMINAEVKTNKTKIEAYLVMYEELLKDLKDKTHEPKYKKSGDIIQRQPALSRTVFDGNTSKLDLLGQQVASDIIHYYARIKTVPDYVELEPDAPMSEAVALVEASVDGAKKLDEISDKILDRFASMMLVQDS